MPFPIAIESLQNLQFIRAGEFDRGEKGHRDGAWRSRVATTIRRTANLYIGKNLMVAWNRCFPRGKPGLSESELQHPDVLFWQNPRPVGASYAFSGWNENDETVRIKGAPRSRFNEGSNGTDGTLLRGPSGKSFSCAPATVVASQPTLDRTAGPQRGGRNRRNWTNR
jgi:hypothetical protein